MCVPYGEKIQIYISKNKYICFTRGYHNFFLRPRLFVEVVLLSVFVEVALLSALVEGAVLSVFVDVALDRVLGA